MPGLKNSKTNQTLDFNALNGRVFSQTDSAYDFFNKSTYVHGYVPAQTDISKAIPLHIGGQQVAIQAIGGGTIAVQGSLDGMTFVSANLVTSADGFTRISDKYRWIRISVSTGLAYITLF